MNVQIPLAVFSLIATWCFTSKDARVKKWGPLFGLAAQPFWFYAAYVAGQWGMVLLSVVYTSLYVNGIRNNRRMGVAA